MPVTRCCSAMTNSTRHSKQALSRKILELEKEVKSGMHKLMMLKVELGLLEAQELEPNPDWIRPEYVKIRTITQAVVNALEHNRYDGVKLGEFEKYLTAAELPFHKPTVTATLGRLKRAGKVIRCEGGIWKLNTLGNRGDSENKAN